MDETLGSVARVLQLPDVVVPEHEDTLILDLLDMTPEEQRTAVHDVAFIKAAEDFARDEDFLCIDAVGSKLYSHSLADALRSLAHDGKAQKDSSAWPADDATEPRSLLADRLLQLHPELEFITCEQAVYEWLSPTATSAIPFSGILGVFLRRRAYAYARRLWRVLSGDRWQTLHCW